jgi:hypothetical protein
MRKLSKTRFSNSEPHPFDAERCGAEPGRIHGATITSWHGSPEIDLDALFACAPLGATVTGGPSHEPVRYGSRSVALSDGTRITFAESGQFMDVSTA